MGEDAAQLRAEIAGVRTDLGWKVDAFEDRVRPRRIVQRRTDALRHRVVRAREAVMGTISDGVATVTEGLSDVGETASGAAGSGGDRIGRVPAAAAGQVRGSPLAMGLVAFGAGVVTAALLPSTRSEQQVAAGVADRLEPVTHELADVAKDMGQHVAEHAKEEARGLAGHAADAAGDLKDEAAAHAQQVAQHSREAARGLTDDVGGGGLGA